jgi:hypothetical protein
MHVYTDLQLGNIFFNSVNCRNYILKPRFSIFQVKFLKTSHLQVFVHLEILLNNLHC